MYKRLSQSVDKFGFCDKSIILSFQPKQDMNPNTLTVNIDFPVQHTQRIKKNISSLSCAGICMVYCTRTLRPVPNSSTKTTKMRLQAHIVDPIGSMLSSLVVKIFAQNRCQKKAYDL